MIVVLLAISLLQLVAGMGVTRQDPHPQDTADAKGRQSEQTIGRWGQSLSTSQYLFLPLQSYGSSMNLVDGLVSSVC